MVADFNIMSHADSNLSADLKTKGDAKKAKSSKIHSQ